MLTVLLIAAGLVLIVVGGNVFVDASVAISERLRIPKFMIGATVVSLATTLPELIVSVLSTLGGRYEMAAGNAVGSIVANTGLILAVALIAAPTETNCRLKAMLLLAAEAITLAFSLGGRLNVLAALPLLAICVAFMALNLSDGQSDEIASSPQKGLVLALLGFFAGVACLIVGSRLLVNKASELAASLGVSDGVIAVTIVALGTSLPELITSITAAVKKESALSLGNILGANIMDIAFIMPVCALIGGGLTIKSQTLLLDLPFCIALTLVAFFPKKSRCVGGILLAIYVVYLILLVTFFV